MRPDKVDAGWVKKAAPAPAQETGERRRPGVKREQGVKVRAGNGGPQSFHNHGLLVESTYLRFHI